MKVNMSLFKRGKGIWKFNCSLLEDPKYIEKINSLIESVKQEYCVPVYNLENVSLIPNNDIYFTLSDSQFLEVLLIKIRGETIKYSSIKKKVQCTRESEIMAAIESLENSSIVHNANLLEEKKQELQELREEKLKGNYIRSRIQWLREGEKPSKFFCSLERRNYLEKTIKKIEKQNGDILTKQEDILSEVRDFYQDLFKNNDSDLDDLTEQKLDEIIHEKISKLTLDESNELEGPLSLTELNNSLRAMKNGKCPGVDGFPSEFYKLFWGKLKFFVLRALNHAYESGEMSISLRQCIISCLPKGNKPRHFLKNC